MGSYVLRILLWNCNNGMSKPAQLEYFKQFKPDLAILPELKFSNIDLLEPDEFRWVTNNHTNPKPKGLGVLTYNNFKITDLPRDEDMEIFIPLIIEKDDFRLNLLAVWNFYYACKQGRFRGVRGEHCLEWSAIRHYSKLFTNPSIVIGDWNFGPKCFAESFQRMSTAFQSHNLKSMYHHFYKIDLAETNHPTFVTTRKNYHQIDHFFGSSFFLENMKEYSVEDFKNVVLSDHAPILVEIADPN